MRVGGRITQRPYQFSNYKSIICWYIRSCIILFLQIEINNMSNNMYFTGPRSIICKILGGYTQFTILQLM